MPRHGLVRRTFLLLPLACALAGCGAASGDLKEGVPADANEKAAKAAENFRQMQEQIGKDMQKAGKKLRR